MEERQALPGHCIFIVDDRRDVRRMLRAGLEAIGHNIRVLDMPSGEEAMLEIPRYRVDLLVADLRLPGISGLELREKALARHPEMKFILISNNTDPDIKREIVNARVDTFFFKPIELPAFLEAAISCLGLQSSLAKIPQVVSPAPEVNSDIPPGETSQPRLIKSVRRARNDLLGILQRLGLPVEERLASELEILNTEMSMEELPPELKAVFSQTAREKLTEDDVDAFWESAAQESQGVILGTDAISYEQAQQLGLTLRED